MKPEMKYSKVIPPYLSLALSLLFECDSFKWRAARYKSMLLSLYDLNPAQPPALISPLSAPAFETESWELEDPPSRRLIIYHKSIQQASWTHTGLIKALTRETLCVSKTWKKFAWRINTVLCLWFVFEVYLSLKCRTLFYVEYKDLEHTCPSIPHNTFLSLDSCIIFFLFVFFFPPLST